MSKSRRDSQEQKKRAFEAVVARYEAPLLRYAVRLMFDHDTAQDVVQDTFIKLLRHWKGEMEPSAHMSNWLYRVAHNRAVDYLRRESRRSLLHRRQAAEKLDYTPPDRGEGFRVSAAAEEAAEALLILNHREQQLVILKVYEEKSYREISEITGLTVGNVGYILHHAMKKLARHLRKRSNAEIGQS